MLRRHRGMRGIRITGTRRLRRHAIIDIIRRREICRRGDGDKEKKNGSSGEIA